MPWLGPDTDPFSAARFISGTLWLDHDLDLFSGARLKSGTLWLDPDPDPFSAARFKSGTSWPAPDPEPFIADRFKSQLSDRILSWLPDSKIRNAMTRSWLDLFGAASKMRSCGPTFDRTIALLKFENVRCASVQKYDCPTLPWLPDSNLERLDWILIQIFWVLPD